MTVLIFMLLGALLGLMLGVASRVFVVESDPLVDKIVALMPGGQCGQCGKAGCRQAAQAMVDGELGYDQCPPGGASLVGDIAQLLGVQENSDKLAIQYIARVEEAQCSGCTRCSKACPFDCIFGATKQIHTVIADVCTGCRLCVDVCPQECIIIEPLQGSAQTWLWPKPFSTEVSCNA
ncbi:RnfABCDGE type electron transport complex subunit B [Vibrio sp. WXL210]|uniref:RnfABCDGE type electron transport complex subunit B n=1 Tax=Vibrio sp. WXL210 TaxID=3450709 RepID=UPI003EC65D1A